MRKALVVGIDNYANVSQLYGCVNDSFSVKSMLDRHADGSVNFGVKHLTATGPNDPVNREELREAIKYLFEGDGEVALFYFAGHGHIEATGGYLWAPRKTSPRPALVKLPRSESVSRRHR